MSVDVCVSVDDVCVSVDDVCVSVDVCVPEPLHASAGSSGFHIIASKIISQGRSSRFYLLLLVCVSHSSTLCLATTIDKG